jgi:hypothetical protein
MAAFPVPSQASGPLRAWVRSCQPGLWETRRDSDGARHEHGHAVTRRVDARSVWSRWEPERHGGTRERARAAGRVRPVADGRAGSFDSGKNCHDIMIMIVQASRRLGRSVGQEQGTTLFFRIERTGRLAVPTVARESDTGPAHDSDADGGPRLGCRPGPRLGCRRWPATRMPARTATRMPARPATRITARPGPRLE